MREEGLSQKQVEAIKWAEETVAKVNNDQRAFVKCKESRPITDLKNMLETSAELFANNVAFLQKYSHKDPYTEIKYSQVMEDVNGLGSALVARGLKGKRVAVIGENCYQWAVSYLAVACGTGIVVPLDRELNAEELKNQIIRAEVSGVLFAKTIPLLLDSSPPITAYSYLISLCPFFNKSTAVHDKNALLTSICIIILSIVDTSFLITLSNIITLYRKKY